MVGARYPGQNATPTARQAKASQAPLDALGFAEGLHSRFAGKAEPHFHSQGGFAYGRRGSQNPGGRDGESDGGCCRKSGSGDRPGNRRRHALGHTVSKKQYELKRAGAVG
jgi:hypothetical protein